MTLAEMRRRYDAGESTIKLAAAAGLNPSTVQRRLRLTGPVRPVGRYGGVGNTALLDAARDVVVEMHDVGYSSREIADRYGVASSTVRQRLKRWAEEEVRRG
jgi:lambda repressor-like predicted transcriptional regulator